MRRPTGQELADGAMMAAALAPWALALYRLQRARSVAPLQAVAWYRMAQLCRSTGLQVGRLGLAAEARYWRSING